jgi:predicted outer membrane lipoprotein
VTNFDPGGFLVLLTVIPAVVAGAVSVGLAQVSARFGYGDYETNVAAVLGVLVLGWIAAALVVSTSMLYILAVTLAMAGAFAATRSVSAASYGWVLGVVLLFAAFAVLAALGVYEGVDRAGQPQDPVSRNLAAFYVGGLFALGAAGGKAVQFVQRRLRADG